MNLDLKSRCESLSIIDVQNWLTQGAIISCGPDNLLIGWGKAIWCTEPDRQQGTNWFYFPDYFLQDRAPWLYFENSEVVSIQELASLLKSLSLKSPNTIVWSLDAKKDFEEGFYDLKRAFSESPLEKAVLYVFAKASGDLSFSNRCQSLITLLDYLQKAPVFAYGFWDQSQGMLGATPELLFRSNEFVSNVIETMALAGTQRTDSISPDILEDEKLLHEHQLVVRDIDSRLESLGKVKVDKLQILSLPVLSHLYTPISVELSAQTNFFTIVRRLHPTPALGGFPRDLAYKWLSDYAKMLPRGRFGAPVGYWDLQSSRMECYVAIRNVMWKDKELMMGAGCGIVKGSDLESEWGEILLKIESIKRFLF